VPASVAVLKDVHTVVFEDDLVLVRVSTGRVGCHGDPPRGWRCGYVATTIEVIAREAAVAPATVYQAFGTKQAILARLLAATIGTLRRELSGRLLIVNEHHLRRVLAEYLPHYTLPGRTVPPASSPLPKPVPSGPNRSTSPRTGSTGSRFSADSPTSTTSQPDCPQVTTSNRISEPHRIRPAASTRTTVGSRRRPGQDSRPWMLALENRRADGGRQGDGGDCGQERVVGDGGEDLVGDAQYHRECQGEAAGCGGGRPPAGQQRAARPGDQQADQDQVRAAGSITGRYRGAQQEAEGP
jgi:hypothetical protein